MTAPIARLRARAGRSLFWRAWEHSRRRDLGTYTLALAAQQVLCTAPLLVAISAIMRRLNAGGVVGMLADYLDLDAQSSRDILALFATHYRASWDDLLLGFGTAFMFATGVAATSQRVFEEIWGLPRADVRSWWRQIVWALALTPLLSLAVWSSHVSRSWSLQAPVEITLEAITFGIDVAVFYGWTQHFLLLGRIKWRRMIPSAILTGIGIGITDVAAQLLVPGQVISEVKTYGLIGATFVLSAWVLVISGVIVVAAVLGFVIDERAEGRPRHTRRVQAR